MGQDKSEIPKK
jgi:hypothetical protein